MEGKEENDEAHLAAGMVRCLAALSPLQHLNCELQGSQDASTPQQTQAPESADWEAGQQGE